MAGETKLHVVNKRCAEEDRARFFRHPGISICEATLSISRVQSADQVGWQTIKFNLTQGEARQLAAQLVAAATAKRNAYEWLLDFWDWRWPPLLALRSLAGDLEGGDVVLAHGMSVAAVLWLSSGIVLLRIGETTGAEAGRRHGVGRVL